MCGINDDILAGGKTRHLLSKCQVDRGFVCPKCK